MAVDLVADSVAVREAVAMGEVAVVWAKVRAAVAWVALRRWELLCQRRHSS